MPFSRISKASLVAMILIILTGVPRLDAAPMFPVPTGWPYWRKGAEQAGELVERPLDLELRLAPPGESSGSSPSIGSRASDKRVAPSTHAVEQLRRARGYIGPGYPAPYAQSTGAQHRQTLNGQARGQHVGYVVPSLVPGYSIPYAHPAGVPNRQRGGQTWAYGTHRAGLSYGAAARNEDRQVLTSGGLRVTIALDAATREAAFGRTPVEGQPWSNDDILKILQGDQWKGLSPDNKAAFLNLFGDKVFTMDFYNRLPDLGEPNWKTGEGDLLTQTLVDEYFQLRMADLVGRPLQLNFVEGARPSATTFWTHFANRFKPKEAESNTFDPISDHPFKAFRLGVFSVKLTGKNTGLTASQAWSALKNADEYMPQVNVVARVSSHDRVYIGQANILTPK